MINFLHNFTPDSILFQYGFLTLHWYGIFVVSGIIAGLFVILKLAKKAGIAEDDVYSLGFYVIIFGLIGARVYSVFLDFPYYAKNPFEIIAVWQGGLAIHGAIIGGAAALLYFTWSRQQSFWRWADLIAPGLALGQAIGRFGNYFNQELFGTPTSLPWGIPIELSHRPLEYLSQPYFHPTFIYESVLNLINFFVLLLLSYKLQVYPVKSEQSKDLYGAASLPRMIQAKRGFVRGYKLKSGLISLIYLVNYSLIRIAMEFLRTDPAPEIFGVRWPIIISVLIIAASLGFIIFKRYNPKPKNLKT